MTIERARCRITAYRAIENPDVRAMFIRLMKEAAKAERETDKELN